MSWIFPPSTSHPLLTQSLPSERVLARVNDSNGFVSWIISSVLILKPDYCGRDRSFSSLWAIDDGFSSKGIRFTLMPQTRKNSGIPKNSEKFRKIPKIPKIPKIRKSVYLNRYTVRVMLRELFTRKRNEKFKNAEFLTAWHVTYSGLESVMCR